MDRNEEYCKKFIADPAIDPKDNHKLQKYKGPYMKYVKLCQKYNYNVDHLLRPSKFPISKIYQLNIFDLCPEEIWIQIISQLTCKKIIEVCCISKQFNDLCKNNKLFERRRLFGFPRITGHCASHDLCELLGLNADTMENLISESYDLVEVLLNDSLDKLYELNIDLVCGDLICLQGLSTYRNNGVFIFDGHNILFLDEEPDEYGSIPKRFTIINNKVSGHYWSSSTIDNDSSTTKGITHNCFCWYDHNLTKREMLDNIKFNDKDQYWYTEFISDNVNYQIICAHDDDNMDYNININYNTPQDKINERDIFNRIISETNLLFLECEDTTDILRGELHENTLFLNLMYKDFVIKDDI